MGVLKLFERGAALFPDRACFVDAKGSRSYAEVKARIEALAGALAADGVVPGQRCAVFSPNSAAAMEAILGIYRVNAVFVPLNTKNQIDENAHILEQAKVETLFYAGKLDQQVAALKDCCPSLRRFVCLDGDASGASTMEALIGRALVPPKSPSGDKDRLVGIYATGGTTGRPKGVKFTPLIWETMAANMFAGLPCREGAVYLAVTPITHAAGTIAKIMLSQGVTIVLHDGFDAQAVLDTIESQHVTHIYLPPTAIYILLAHPDLLKRDLSSIECFMYAASPMSVQKLRECMDVFGPVMVQFWGQTEAPIFCTCLDQRDHALALADHPERLASCGRPMLLTPVAVMGEDGRLLGVGERGELVVRGNLVMAGYLDNPEATAAATRDGWHRTGDVGYRDERGYFYIVDRLKDMIISGGFNVYPAEVEQVLWSHPAVKECAVIGVPHEKWGEAIKAVIELKPGRSATAEELTAWCRTRLGSIKTPKSVEFWDMMPLTPVGKVDKKAIRARYWQGEERAI